MLSEEVLRTSAAFYSCLPPEEGPDPFLMRRSSCLSCMFVQTHVTNPTWQLKERPLTHLFVEGLYKKSQDILASTSKMSNSTRFTPCRRHNIKLTTRK